MSELLGRITIDPEICHGKPPFTASRRVNLLDGPSTEYPEINPLLCK